MSARGPLREYRNSPAAAPHRLDAPDMHPPTCRTLGAEPTDPTLLGHTCKRRWQEGGTHSCANLVSAENELGTLPVSLLSLRSLHTRSGLGRSAVLRRTHGNHVPLPYPRTVPHRMGCPLSTPQSRGVPRVPSESIPQQPCCRTAPLDAPDMQCIPPTCRALGAEPTDPTLLGRTRKRHWQQVGTHSASR